MAEFVAIHAARVSADPATLRVVEELEAAGALSTDHAVVRDDELHLELSLDAVAELRRLHVTVEVSCEVREGARRVQHLTRPPLRLIGDGHLAGFVHGYLDAAAIHARLAALHREFPSLTTLEDLPFASHGYDGARRELAGPSPVKLLRITTAPASLARPCVLITAGSNGRAWIAPLAALELAEQLLRNHAPGSSDAARQRITALVDGLDWLIVPALNPDGIHYAHHDDAAWSLNRRRPRPGAPHGGVDLGRNFGVSPSAFSEPETRNLRALVERFPHVLAAIDCQSRGERLVRPQPSGGGLGRESIGAADHALYAELETAMNAAIGAVTPGKRYAAGGTAYHAGTCEEYLYFAHRIFAIAVRCGQELQPPIGDAQVAALEVAAAALALGDRALLLAAEGARPRTLVQAIDRSASVDDAGHADAVLAATRRAIDLLAPGDRAGLVAFGDGAVVEVPLAAVHGGMRTTALACGGWTSIGAGLEAAAAQLDGDDGALLLLSDGHENRPPMVAAILPTLPAGRQVHTVALGPAADQPLLQDLAAATGGHYYFAPDELALPEVFHFAHADAIGEQVLYNHTALLDGATDEPDVIHAVPIEACAASATFCVTLAGQAGEPVVSLIPPGRSHAHLPRPRWRDGHWIVRVRRPEAGVWRVRVQPPRTGDALCNVAAFVRSTLRLEPPELSSKIPLDTLIGLEPRVLDGDRPVRALRVTRTVLAPIASLAQLARTRSAPRAAPSDRVDALPPPVHEALAIRHATLHSRGIDPIAHRLLPVPFALPSPLPGGSYNLRYEVRGNCPRSGRFVRIAMRSVCLDDA